MLAVTFIDESQPLSNQQCYSDSDSENGDSLLKSPVKDTPTSTSTSISHAARDEASHSPFDDERLKSDLPPLPHSTQSWNQSDPSTFEVHQHISLPRLPGLPHHDFTQSPSPVSSTPGTTTHHESTHIYHEGNNTFQENPTPISLPSIYLDKPVWPLIDPQEARLLRHFVQNLAIWLDLCDPAQHFQVEVPRRAGTCPILLNAIFALSARHLNLTGSYDALASNRYHQECLKYLIPMLNNTATVSDETLFAATIILRVLEEIDC
jgi:hypothetical protein